MIPETSDGKIAHDKKDDWLIHRVNALEKSLRTIRNDIRSLYRINREIEFNDTMFTLRKIYSRVDLELSPRYIEFKMLQYMKGKK